MATKWDPWKKNYSLDNLLALAELFGLQILKHQEDDICFPMILVQIPGTDNVTEIVQNERGEIISQQEIPGVPTEPRPGTTLHTILI